MQQQGAVNMESSHVPQQFKRTKLRHILLQQPEPSPATTTMKPSCPPPHFPDFPTTPSKTVIDSSLLLSSPSLSMNYDTTVLTDNRYYLNTSNNISCLSQQQQGLCLSLSSHSQHNNSPLMSGVVSTRSDFSASSVPLGPFTGYASVLNRSRLLKPAQQLLDDFCYGSRGDPPHCFGGKAAWISCDDDDIDPPIPEQKWNNNNNSSLIQLLEEVFKRYKLYCQQIQSVIASFESVSGLGNAAPYFIFAFKSMSKHFSCLKTAIVEQVHRSGNFEGNDGESKSSMASVNRKPVRNLPFLKHHVWRSQRGLPSRAVVVLKKWLFEHFLHPYPSDADKQMLAQQTGLSRTQVSNWFINARVRLWKPMVEEIHGLETHKAPVPSEPRSPRAIQSMGHQISSNALSLKPSSLMYRTNMEEDVHISGTSAYRRRAADNADISLALGLQQNHFPGGRAFLHGHFLPS